VGAFGAPVGHRVERLERRRDLAGGRDLQRESPVGDVGQRGRERLGAAVDEIERRLEA
jgi:hypothetical protein